MTSLTILDGASLALSLRHTVLTAINSKDACPASSSLENSKITGGLQLELERETEVAHRLTVLSELSIMKIPLCTLILQEDRNAHFLINHPTSEITMSSDEISSKEKMKNGLYLMINGKLM
jgi:hypothetical protein